MISNNSNATTTVTPPTVTPSTVTPPTVTPPTQTNNDWCEDDFYVIN